MLVEPKTRYKLHFSARTKEVVTGGLPLIVVNGAGSGGPTLAQSNTLPQGTQGWSDYTVDFTTGDGMRAVLISLQRQPCTGGPCPIFGRLWLDAFTVEKLSANLAPNSN
jgi:hypothetical protein